jgi:hypothetical protein
MLPPGAKALAIRNDANYLTHLVSRRGLCEALCGTFSSYLVLAVLDGSDEGRKVGRFI